jgi:uncharacterized RDD family membrane protein YckC
MSESIPAPLWRRLAACIYDLLPLLALWFATDALALLLSGGKLMNPHPPLQYKLPLQLALLSITAAYFVLSWTRGGQTLGARAWRVRVVRADGSRVTVADALARFALGWLSLLVLGLGFVWCLIDPQRRCWHDLGSGTRLLRTSQASSDPSP